MDSGHTGGFVECITIDKIETGRKFSVSVFHTDRDTKILYLAWLK